MSNKNEPVLKGLARKQAIKDMRGGGVDHPHLAGKSPKIAKEELDALNLRVEKQEIEETQRVKPDSESE